MAEDGDRPVVVRDLLAEAARRVDVRVLLWAGAPIPVFRPSRRAVRAVRDELAARRPDPLRAGQARAAASLPPREDRDRRRPGRVRRRDRLDVAGRRPPRLASSHPPRAALGWHDAAVRIDGPLVADVADHFAMRWAAVTGERLAPAAIPDPAGDGVTAQFVRTCPEHVYPALAGRIVRRARVLRARTAVGRAADLSRVPVPLVAGDRRGAGRQAAAAARRPVPAGDRAALASQGRRRRHARRAGRADRGRPGRRPRAVLLPVRPRGGRRRPGLRPRQGGDRRRPVADRRDRPTSTTTRSSTTPRRTW